MEKRCRRSRRCSPGVRALPRCRTPTSLRVRISCGASSAGLGAAKHPWDLGDGDWGRWEQPWFSSGAPGAFGERSQGCTDWDQGELPGVLLWSSRSFWATLSEHTMCWELSQSLVIPSHSGDSVIPEFSCCKTATVCPHLDAECKPSPQEQTSHPYKLPRTRLSHSNWFILPQLLRKVINSKLTT